MKSIFVKWMKLGIVTRIVICLIIGIILGLAVPSFTLIGLLGDIFIGALKAIAPVLVALLVMSSMAKSGSNIGGRFKTVILLYMLTTFLAALVAVAASYLFPIQVALNSSASGNPPKGIIEVLTNLLSNIVANPIASVSEGNYIGLLFWSILIGIALKYTAKAETKNFLNDFTDAISKVVHWIIQCAPYGIMGLIYKVVSDKGLIAICSYGKLIAELLICMFIVALVINPIIVAITLKQNPYPLVFTCLKESGVIAFFTRSSAANIPINMKLCEKLGLDKDFYSISIPLGSAINMDGAAITITVMTLCAANTVGVSVDIPTAILLSIIATLGACGASGVAGGSLLLIPMACSLFGIDNEIAMQMVGIGFIIGVIQDSVETALNSSGDVLLTTTAELYERKKKNKNTGRRSKNDSTA